MLKKIIDWFLKGNSFKQQCLDLKIALQEEKETSNNYWERWCRKIEDIKLVERVSKETIAGLVADLKKSQDEVVKAKLLLRQIANHETTTQGIDTLKRFIREKG